MDTLLTKWSRINHRSGIDQGKFASQRPTFYPLSHAANVSDFKQSRQQHQQPRLSSSSIVALLSVDSLIPSGFLAFKLRPPKHTVHASRPVKSPNPQTYRRGAERKFTGLWKPVPETPHSPAYWVWIRVWGSVSLQALDAV